MKNIEEIIKETTDENVLKTDWTKVWSKKYPILKRYQHEVDIPFYAEKIKEMLDDLSLKYDYSELDSMLVLKDILAHVYFKK